MDTLENLKFFIKLVEKGGVAVAGRDFGLSPATASERLAKLERDYGAKLVNRTTRSLSLTDEGRILLEGARGLVSDADDLEGRIKFGMDRVSGPIKVAAPHDLGTGYVTRLLDGFIEENPGVRIHLHLEDQYLDLAASGIDLAIRLGPLQDSSLRRRKLANNHRIVVASPAYLKKHGAPLHPKDLTEHNCLIMHWGLITDHEWSFKVKGRKKVVSVAGDRSSNSGFQVKNWCLAGHGIAFKSNWDVTQYIESGELVEILPEYKFDQGSAVQMLYPGGNKPPRRVRALIDFLAEHYESNEESVEK